MSELLKGITPAEPPRPRDSALGVVVRHGDDGWEVLLGRRSRSSRFMPGHLAFPGGNLDPADRPDEPGALERCVSRELEEEVGLCISPESWLPAGARITPPMFPVRFNARFFVAASPEGFRIPEVPPSPEEIESMAFERPASVLARWETGEALVPPPVLPVLRILSAMPAERADSLAEVLSQINKREHERTRMEFVPDIWVLPLRTDTLPPATHTNVWMPGGDSFVIVDPGSDDPDEIAFLLRVVDRRIKLASRPAFILLTHHHQDHTRGARTLAAELGIPVRGHAVTLERLEHDGLDVDPISDGDVVDLGGVTLLAVDTPGHAPGHLAFHVPERDALIAGDLLGGMSTIVIDPDGGDMGVYLDSLRRVSGLGCRTVLPAHGPPLPARAIKKTIQHRLMRENRVLEAIPAEGTRSLEAIAAESYADTPAAPVVLKEMQTEAHLLHLEAQKRARREGPGSRRWSR